MGTTSSEGPQVSGDDPLIALLTDVLPGVAELAGAETAYVVRRDHEARARARARRPSWSGPASTGPGTTTS